MSVVHVAVAVIIKPGERFFDRDILISKRPEDVHQGGLWEFPGGKVEDTEVVVEALARELDEELGIQIDQSADSLQPLIEIHHDYGDKQVFLDVWLVSEFDGEPHGKEGQPVRWVPLLELGQYDFPAANRPILSACRLPRSYAITPIFSSIDDAKANLKRLADQGQQLILLRQPQLALDEYLAWADSLIPVCRALDISLMASGFLDALEIDGFAGIQLPWREAEKLEARPISSDLILSVSCHNADELSKAESLGADFATLSPIQMTKSHPEVAPMGWGRFEAMVHQAKLPIFALGGLDQVDQKKAIDAGAQGIAGISCWQA